MTSQDWLKGNQQGRVSIDGHDLFLRADGPDRIPGQPVVILESGLGGSSVSWPLVTRYLTPFVRVYTHDRAGLGKSEINPSANQYEPRVYAEKAAEDLDKLLQKAGVDGPFILVPMSWGGIVAREFLERRKDDVVGMVMIECVQERTTELRPIDAPNTMAFLRGLDFFEVVGVKDRHRLTPVEWRTQLQEIAENGPQTAVETFAWPLTEKTLGEKMQFERQILGSKPISVIKGNAAREYQQVYDAGVAAGNGTEEQRAIVSKMIDGMEEKEETLQREQLNLSSVSRFVQLEKPGHLVILEEPEAIAAEVQWVLEKFSQEK
ncbi:alpha/beta hydrolase [Ilyonectria robusta]|uniref:alpha/beta hydrolase n=1 Tax=Ilyonectria robusta TaxID=1079257 RepID=UPI001E8CD268|nr:alpha/beta hydrolase [Ilyonectria robusta]KAH8664878.1 alpha/beta hydrolase [Ilyonectria robusta]